MQPHQASTKHRAEINQNNARIDQNSPVLMCYEPYLPLSCWYEFSYIYSRSFAMVVNINRLKIVKIVTNDHRVLRRLQTLYHLDSYNATKNKYFVVKFSNYLAGLNKSIKTIMYWNEWVQETARFLVDSKRLMNDSWSMEN